MAVGWMFNKQMSVGGLAGWDNTYEGMCCYNRCHGNTGKEIWSVLSNV
jgi:hypothetical protein